MKRILQKYFLVSIFVLSGIISFVSPSSQAAPAGLYGTLGIIPGLGHVANGQVLEGLGWFGATVGLLGSRNSLISYIGMDIWFYNMYDAYKDAGAAHADKYSIFHHYLASFNPGNISDAIGGPIVGLGAMAGANKKYPAIRSGTGIIKYSFVGLGEESLFRGFMYPSMSSLFFDSQWMGALTSSALFSAAHGIGDPSAFGTVPLAVRFVLGMFFCWQLERNKYDLDNNIFAHSWYDIFVGPAASVEARFKVMF